MSIALLSLSTLPISFFLTADGFRYNFKVHRLLLFAIQKGAEAVADLAPLGPTSIEAKRGIRLGFCARFPEIRRVRDNQSSHILPRLSYRIPMLTEGG
jgi:hypothetical protein